MGAHTFARFSDGFLGRILAFILMRILGCILGRAGMEFETWNLGEFEGMISRIFSCGCEHFEWGLTGGIADDLLGCSR
jgi:hypothetical protein